MSTEMSTVSPQWTDLLKPGLTLFSSQKKKKAHVSIEQRQVLLDFVLENPEMVTHSSTKENELSLWTDLTEKLNAMLPEKPMDFWQKFWKRWVSSIETKNEASLTMIDFKLKKFLRNVTVNNENIDQPNNPTIPIRKKMSIQEICNNIREIEEEKNKLQQDIDNMEHHIVNCKATINVLKKNISLKRKHCKQLSIKKANFNNKRRKMEEKENMNKV